MSFAGPLFLWYFLPAVLAAVVIAPGSWRNGIVAIASLVFYAVGAGPTSATGDLAAGRPGVPVASPADHRPLPRIGAVTLLPRCYAPM
jgi:hypothetical protein